MKLKEFFKENIEKVFFIILCMSLFFIFFQFIIGQYYYVYYDSGTDTINQYYPYFVNEVMNLKNGTFSIWNFGYGLGTCLLNMNAWTFDIFGILLVVTGIIVGVSKVQYFLVWMQIVKIIVIYFLSKKYLSYFLKDKTSICLASYLSAMNGFVFLWGQHFFLGTSYVYILAMLCILEECLLKEKKYSYIKLSIVVASLLIFSYYIGYIVLLISAGYFLFRYFAINEQYNFKNILKDFVICLYSVLVGILLAGVVFIPSCYNLLTTSSRLDSANTNIAIRTFNAFKESFDFEFINESVSRLMSNNLHLSIYDPNYYESKQLFCTIFIFFFIIQFFIYEFKNDKTIKEYILTILKLILCYFLIFNKASGLIFNFFVKPAYRYTFSIIPFMVLMIGIVFEKVIKEKQINIYGLIFSMFFSFVVLTYNYYNGSLLLCNCYYVFLFFLILGFVSLFLIKLKNKNEDIFQLCLIVFVFGIVFTSCLDNYVCTNYRKIKPSKYEAIFKHNQEHINDTWKAVEWLRENDKSFYRVELTYKEYSYAGDPFFYRISTTTYYNSTINVNLEEYYDKVFKSSYNGIRIFELKNNKLNINDLRSMYITNSKYILSKIELNKIKDLEEIKKIGDVYIYRNNSTNSVAKFFTKTLTDKEYLNEEKNGNFKLLFDSVITDQKLDLDENAQADVREFYLKKPTYIVGKVKCDGKGMLMISVPYQEGWSVYVDGKKVENIYRADYGFIGIILDKGDHSIELKYSLPQIEIGAICTILGIINLIIIVVINKRK